MHATAIDAVCHGMSCIAQMGLYAAVDIPGRLTADLIRDALDTMAVTESAFGACYEPRWWRSLLRKNANGT